jgi:hypothetical protein
MLKYPASQEPTQTGFTVAFGTENTEPMFTTFSRDPPRAKRFGGAMVSLTGGEGYEPSYFVDNYDWATLDAAGGTVVDVGGSHGFMCVALAERFPNLRFVVQDLDKMIASHPQLEGDLAARIAFQGHDFYTPQPVKGADVYFYRWILHNQSTAYCVRMLRALIPAMKKGARVLVNDHCLKEPGLETAWDERIMRTMDLVMLTLINAQERSEEEFKGVFAEAGKGWGVDGQGSGFRFVGVTRPEGCRMSIVEAVWEGEDFGGEKHVQIGEDGRVL